MIWPFSKKKEEEPIEYPDVLEPPKWWVMVVVNGEYYTTQGNNVPPRQYVNFFREQEDLPLKPYGTLFGPSQHPWIYERCKKYAKKKGWK